jgi:transcriptional regulator with XRE-family HTH domain/quercetin dioxygenase-like cupin family protein
MTVRELARQLGVSPSFVSQLENGKSRPSVATLYSLAQFLGVSMDRLFDEHDHPTPPPGSPTTPRSPRDPLDTSPADETTPDHPAPVNRERLSSPTMAWGEYQSDSARVSLTTPHHRTRLVMDSGVVWEQLVRKTDHLDFMEITYPPGSNSTTDGRMLRHDDYEYGVLLEGELEITVGFDVFTLRAGEAIGFDSSIPHLFRNLGTTPARGIWVVHHRHQ